MRRVFRVAVLGAVGFALVASFGAGAAPAADSGPSGIYEGTSTLVSWTPLPADSGAGADQNKPPHSPVSGTVILDCTKGPACTTFYPPYGRVKLNPAGTGHYRGEGIYPSGCPWRGAAPTAVFDVRVADGRLTETTSTRSGAYHSACPGQTDRNTFYTPGVSWKFEGTLRGSSGSTPSTAPGGTASGTPAKRGASTSGAATRRSAMSTRQLENAVAVHAGRLSSVPGSLQSPSEAFNNAGHVAQNIALAAVLVLLLVFPSQLFNSTFDKHHERITAPWRQRFGRRPKAESPEPTSSTQRAVTYGAVVVAGALLAGFLDPKFGFKTASYALFVGVIASTVFGAALGAFVNRGYRRARHFSASAILVAVPAGLAIAFACVVVSRVAHFQPGYLYGLVGGFSFLVALDTRDSGRAHFTQFLVGLLVACAGWILFVPVSHAANNAHPGFGLLAVDAFLSAVFIGGIEGALLTLVPLRFLPGHDVARWSWVGWSVLAFATSFLFVDALLRPETGYLGQSSSASAIITYGLFAVFGIASVAFWGWFRTHPDPIGEPEPFVAV